MTHGIWCGLTLFEGTDVGGKDTPELTLQAAEESGETVAHAPVAGEQEEEKGREKAFRDLIEGEYKDLFTAYFQETFNRRFKEQKGMMEELARARTVIDAAAERFGSRDERELCAALRAETGKDASTETATEPPAADVPAADAAEAQADVIAAAVREAVERTREETERAVLDSIRARGLRPVESALIPGVGAYQGNGAAHLTRHDRAEMARRSLRGERIEF
ncbi:MAG: hypothetical protein IJC99_07135 [Clostridia bacterium]|nr:hypothetical protein [Clostridia bacterium]